MTTNFKYKKRDSKAILCLECGEEETSICVWSDDEFLNDVSSVLCHYNVWNRYHPKNILNSNPLAHYLFYQCKWDLQICKWDRLVAKWSGSSFSLVPNSSHD